jgi:hypothetical protein
MEVVSVDKKETFDEENEKLYYGFRPWMIIEWRNEWRKNERRNEWRNEWM